jgi:PEP-CTERM motif
VFKIKGFAVAGLFAGLMAVAPAQASTIDLGGSSCSGSTCGPLGGILNLTTDPESVFGYKTFNLMTGLGVNSAAPTAGEIDVNEGLNGAFTSAQVITSFRVLFLYNGTEFGDLFETMMLTINGTTFGTLIANAENVAVWSLPGATVTNCGGALNSTELGPGCYDVSNPFGTTSVSSLRFTAVHSPGGINNDSDFSLGSLTVNVPATTNAVPEPASLTLLGLGLAVCARKLRSRKNLPI